MGRRSIALLSTSCSWTAEELHMAWRPPGRGRTSLWSDLDISSRDPPKDEELVFGGGGLLVVAEEWRGRSLSECATVVESQLDVGSRTLPEDTLSGAGYGLLEFFVASNTGSIVVDVDWCIQEFMKFRWKEAINAAMASSSPRSLRSSLRIASARQAVLQKSSGSVEAEESEEECAIEADERFDMPEEDFEEEDEGIVENQEENQARMLALAEEAATSPTGRATKRQQTTSKKTTPAATTPPVINPSFIKLLQRLPLAMSKSGPLTMSTGRTGGASNRTGGNVTVKKIRVLNTAASTPSGQESEASTVSPAFQSLNNATILQARKVVLISGNQVRILGGTDDSSEELSDVASTVINLSGNLEDSDSVDALPEGEEGSGMTYVVLPQGALSQVEELSAEEMSLVKEERATTGRGRKRKEAKNWSNDLDEKELESDIRSVSPSIAPPAKKRRPPKEPSQPRKNQSIIKQLDIPPDGSGVIFVCSQCGRRYQRQSTLIRHFRYECGLEKKYECRSCHTKFRHRFILKRHILAVHPNQVYRANDPKVLAELKANNNRLVVPQLEEETGELAAEEGPTGEDGEVVFNESNPSEETPEDQSGKVPEVYEEVSPETQKLPRLSSQRTQKSMAVVKSDSNNR
ncbi:unnamed protein product [Cyprideis torosa]|uniref:Uncharacterized protein n=1 Tax=Cyprideis torosa TaxID=163714 RepID=A0A7R8W286_9CRUS|nr:unnamed protein product [Cyprideis torosa]CAG0881688.1 unnamed protein product [Cyprideis torosa]